MPQFILILLVVIASSIYMFQSFSATGNNIEAMAQKNNLLLEINQIKLGLNLALKNREIETKSINNNIKIKSSLIDLAKLNYFDTEINEQIIKNNSKKYNAISFQKNGYENVEMSIYDQSDQKVPGIKIEIKKDSQLYKNRGILESMISKDLKNIAYINNQAKLAFNQQAGLETDGIFAIFFKDIGPGIR